MEDPSFLQVVTAPDLRLGSYLPKKTFVIEVAPTIVSSFDAFKADPMSLCEALFLCLEILKIFQVDRYGLGGQCI